MFEISSAGKLCACCNSCRSCGCAVRVPVMNILAPLRNQLLHRIHPRPQLLHLAREFAVAIGQFNFWAGCDPFSQTRVGNPARISIEKCCSPTIFPHVRRSG